MRRPVAMVAAILVMISMATLTWKGATAKESIAAENVLLVPEWSTKQGFAGNAKAVRGAEIFSKTGCMNCHTYLGAGGSYPGAPNLSAIGSTGRNAAYFSDYVANPAKYNKSMPAFPDLGADNLAALGAFLSASKGEK